MQKMNERRQKRPGCFDMHIHLPPAEEHEYPVYKVGRTLRRFQNRPGFASLYAEGTYVHTYRQGIQYENYHAPFFLFINEQQARAFLAETQERFVPTVSLALWRGTTIEIWNSPSHVYSGYKRDLWPSYWRAYERQQTRGTFQKNEKSFFTTVALHPLASPIATGTVLSPVFRPDDCLIIVHGKYDGKG